MKLLYITPKSPQHDSFNKNSEKLFEFKTTTQFLTNQIQENLDSIEISFIYDLFENDETASINKLKEYDLFLCDVTASNPNVTYFTGVAGTLGKPIIYIISHESTLPISMVGKRFLMYSDSSLEDEFIDALLNTLKAAIKDPSSFVIPEHHKKTTPKVFISYSHADKKYLDRLMTHLKPLSKKGMLDIWVDTKIKSGDKWKEEIEKALSEANIAILLISADFMASDFIVDNELPPILTRAEVKGTKILPVVLTPCRFSREPSLSCFQAVNNPSEPLSLMASEKREVYFDSVASDIEKTIQA